MNIQELKELLATDIVTVTFTKKNGERRVMLCTTISEYLPETSSVEHTKPSTTNLVTVWDLEQSAWRSFNFDSIRSIETEYFNYAI